jgi:cbb3-type cytochrome oxidase maturation protein
MEILYLLIPLSALLVLAIIGVFGWALYRGQFEDLDEEGERILLDDDGIASKPDGHAGLIDAEPSGIPSSVPESAPAASAPAKRTSSRGEV